MDLNPTSPESMPELCVCLSSFVKPATAPNCLVSFQRGKLCNSLSPTPVPRSGPRWGRFEAFQASTSGPSSSMKRPRTTGVGPVGMASSEWTAPSWETPTDARKRLALNILEVLDCPNPVAQWRLFFGGGEGFPFKLNQPRMTMFFPWPLSI